MTEYAVRCHCGNHIQRTDKDTARCHCGNHVALRRVEEGMGR